MVSSAIDAYKPEVSHWLWYLLTAAEAAAAGLSEGDVQPAVVLKVNGDGSLNLRVLLDSTLQSSIRVTSIVEGAVGGTWCLPFWVKR